MHGSGKQMQKDLAEYYEGKEEGKVIFRFNAEKGCFEETMGKD